MNKEDIFALIIIIAMIIVTKVVETLLRKQSGIKNQKRIKGEITSFILASPRRYRSPATYYADVEYMVEGRKYIVRSKVASSDYNKIGKKLFVTYDEKYPSHSIVEVNLLDMLYMLIFLGIMGYICMKIKH